MIKIRELIVAIFGDYQPITYSAWNDTLEAFETVIPPGLAGVDWTYVLGVLGFFIVLYCALRILGGIICAD